MPDYNLLGSTEVLEELQEGRTRELLLLLQDKPVPEVQDPINVQSDDSFNFIVNNGQYEIATNTNYSGGENDVLNGGGNQTRTLESFGSGGDVSVSITNGSTNIGRSTEYNLVVDGQTIDTLSTDQNSFSLSGSKDNISSSFSVQLEVNNNSGNNFSYSYDYSITYSGRFAKITDNFAAPTTSRTNFKAWSAIRAEGVTTGGSTSATPVEFEILDSTGSVFNSARIPKSRIADEPFVMRNRLYSENAGSDGQSDYQIATTGDGGHFGIPILTVISVKKNGSVLDSANWSFEPDTDTVSINTSNVTIASGDTIDIKYDFDVFDSTLQPRAYLSRESTSETSPSISHFRYEYVI